MTCIHIEDLVRLAFRVIGVGLIAEFFALAQKVDTGIIKAKLIGCLRGYLDVSTTLSPASHSYNAVRLVPPGCRQ
jgi:hypothetical protein